MRIRMLRGLAVALIAMAGTVLLVIASTITTLIQLTATTALIMGGTGMKTPAADDQWGPGSYLDNVNETYLQMDSSMVTWVSTPEQFWPATGLTDISFDASVARGVLSLDDAIRTTTGTKVVVGYSQSAAIATQEKRHLDDLRAAGATDIPAADDLSFVLVANPNRPNGGILERLNGLSIPLLGVSFNGATPDDEYTTIDVARQYDAVADFPEYPLNLLADVNALFGYFYLHPNYGSGVVNLDDPSTYQSSTSGNTTYYLIHTEHLPLLQPLRDLGVPKAAVDLVEPALRVVIELGYDRTPANMGVPTPARLFRKIDPETVVSDLSAALRQGVHDARDDLGIPRTPQPRTAGTNTSTDTEPQATETKSKTESKTEPDSKSTTETPARTVPKPPRSVLRDLKRTLRPTARPLDADRAEPKRQRRSANSTGERPSSHTRPGKSQDTQHKPRQARRDSADRSPTRPDSRRAPDRAFAAK